MIPRSPYVEVYSVLDRVSFGGSSPAGARGSMYRAIDRLRREAAPMDHIALAELISVALHKLDWAIQQRDAAMETDVREELQVLGAKWHQTPMTMCLN